MIINAKKKLHALQDSLTYMVLFVILRYTLQYFVGFALLCLNFFLMSNQVIIRLIDGSSSDTHEESNCYAQIWERCTKSGNIEYRQLCKSRQTLTIISPPVR